MSSFSHTLPPPLSLRYPVPHFLRRNFDLHPVDQKNNLTLQEVITPSNVRRLLQLPDANKFFHDIEGSHNLVHKFVGGDLNGKCPEPVGGVHKLLEDDDDELGEAKYEAWKKVKGHGPCEGGFTANGMSSAFTGHLLLGTLFTPSRFTVARPYILCENFWLLGVHMLMARSRVAPRANRSYLVSMAKKVAIQFLGAFHSKNSPSEKLIELSCSPLEETLS